MNSLYRRQLLTSLSHWAVNVVGKMAESCLHHRLYGSVETNREKNNQITESTE